MCSFVPLFAGLHVCFSLFSSPVFICFSFVSLCFVCLLDAAYVLVCVGTCTLVGLERTPSKVATMGYGTGPHDLGNCQSRPHGAHWVPFLYISSLHDLPFSMLQYAL